MPKAASAVKIANAGIPLTVERTYDSRIKDKRDFGVGWVLTGQSSGITEELRAFLYRLARLAVIVQGGLWANELVSLYLHRIVTKRAATDLASVTTINALAVVTRIVLWVVVFLVALANFGVDITALVTGLGIAGVAVALAVQNVLGDLLASLSIVLDKPFVVGDFIVVGDMPGTVEKVGLKTTRVRALSGEQLVFSNADLLGSRIRNYKRMQERRIVFHLDVVYGTPPDVVDRMNAEIQKALVVHLVGQLVHDLMLNELNTAAKSGDQAAMRAAREPEVVVLLAVDLQHGAVDVDLLVGLERYLQRVLH